MDWLIADSIDGFIQGGLSTLDLAWKDITSIALHAERYMDSLSGSNWFSAVYDVLFQLGIALIILKFLKKGFGVYIAWQEGDPDGDPMQLLTGFAYALGMALSFPFFYGLLANVVTEVMDLLIVAIGGSTEVDTANLFGNITTDAGLFSPIAFLAHYIMLLLLYIQFLKRGLEMLILRIGMPVACTGLIDSNQGMFAPWMKKFFQSSATILIQVCLGKIGVSLMGNNHFLWSFASFSMALATPKFLQEFMIVSGGGAGSIMSNVFQTTRVVQSIKNLVSSVGK